MKFTQEQVDMIFSQFNKIVESLDYPAMIMLATPEETLSTHNDLLEMSTEDEKQKAFCSANSALICLIKS